MLPVRRVDPRPRLQRRGEREPLACAEAADDAVMARYVLQLGGLGFVRTKTLKAFPGGCLPRNSFARWANEPSSRSKPSVPTGRLRPTSATSRASRPPLARFVRRGRDRRLPQHRMGLILAGACPTHRRSAPSCQGSGGGVSSRGGDTAAAQRASAARKSGIHQPCRLRPLHRGGGSAASGSDVAGGSSSGDVSISSPRVCGVDYFPSARFFCELHAPRYGCASGELKLTHSSTRRTR